MNLLIRADAGPRIGAGHLMRCLALAQGWQARGGQVTFLTVCESVGLLRRLTDEGFQVIRLAGSYPDPVDWALTAQVLAEHPGAWVVLDGYHFDMAYQRQIKESGHPLLVIDDMAHLEHYVADVVLNQNINAEQLRYSCEPYTRFLLGTRYALLRSEFLVWRGWQRTIPKAARKVLVTLGGADPDNLTLKVIQALQQMATYELQATVVVGASNPHFQTLQSATQKSKFPLRLVRNVTNMPELMAWADFAVSGGGSTCWELAFMGLPSVLMVLAENQRAIALELDRRGVALSLGWHTQIKKLEIAHALKKLISNATERQRLSEAGQMLVDGSGADGVLSIMSKATKSPRLGDKYHLRRAGFQDAELIWKWANDPSVRARSFHSEPIPLERHLKWYEKKLASPDTRLWILELNQIPVAQIRYDRIDIDSAEIGFSVAKEYRGRGLGTKTLIFTSYQACRELKVKRLKGVVFISNKASARAFIKAAFKCVGEQLISNKHSYVFVRECFETEVSS